MTKKEVLDWLYRIKSKLTMYFPIKWVSECEQAIEYAIKALENQKTGHWIVYSELNGEWEGTKKYACDKCGVKVGVFKSNFCPNCGAKMEGEQK